MLWRLPLDFSFKSAVPFGAVAAAFALYIIGYSLSLHTQHCLRPLFWLLSCALSGCRAHGTGRFIFAHALFVTLRGLFFLVASHCENVLLHRSAF